MGFVGYTSDGREVWTKDPVDGCAGAIFVLWLICWGISRLVDAVQRWLENLWTAVWDFIQNWFFAFHFSNPFECVLHLYIWIVHVPILLLAVIAVGGLIGGIVGGFWGGTKLTGMIPFGEGGWETFGKVVVWLVLTAICLAVSGGIGFFILFQGGIACIKGLWEFELMLKDKVLKMEWLGEVTFGIAVYLVIPVLLFVGYIFTRAR